MNLRIFSIFLICSLLLSSTSYIGAQKKQSSGLFVIIQNDKRGYIDKTGEIVIAPQFDGASIFSEGLAAVSIGGKDGFIDVTGKFITTPQFYSSTYFSEGLAPVSIDAGIDKSCPGCSHKELWGYVDRTGTIVIKPQYQDAGDFSEGLAPVKNKRGRWGYIDKLGNAVTKFRFRAARKFSEGLALVQIGRKTGFIDKSGIVVIKPKFRTADNFSEGLASVLLDGKHWGYINKSGEVGVRLPENIIGNSFSEGLAMFRVDDSKNPKFGHCGFINKVGTIIIEPKFTSCNSFSEGLASVFNGQWHYIDQAGNIVITTPFDLVRDFMNGLAWVQEGIGYGSSKYGYIDKSGRIIWNPSN